MLIGVVYQLNYRWRPTFYGLPYRRSHLLLDWRATLREEWNQSPQFVGEPGVVLPFCWWAVIWNRFHFSILCTYIIYNYSYMFSWNYIDVYWCAHDVVRIIQQFIQHTCLIHGPQSARPTGTLSVGFYCTKVAQSWKLSQLGSFHIFINCMEKNCGSTVPHGLHRSPT